MQRAIHDQRAAGAPQPKSGPGGFADRFRPSPEQTRVMKTLWPFIWPSDRPDLRRTVSLSLILIIIAKVVTVSVPYTLKWATDALVAQAGGRIASNEALPWLIGAPVMAAILYGLSRILMSLLVQVVSWTSPRGPRKLYSLASSTLAPRWTWLTEN